MLRDKFTPFGYHYLVDEPMENFKILNDQSLLKYAKREAGRLLNDLGLPPTAASPRYYILEGGSVLPQHIDTNTQCSINVVLNNSAASIHFEEGSYDYNIAVLNTSMPHGVDNTNHGDRLLFKISFFDNSYEEIVERCSKL